jgi:hypothetical protein
MPDEAPVTIARLPERSMPAMTSAAVESNPDGVLMRLFVVMTLLSGGFLDVSTTVARPLPIV